ncbi:MAG: hypothetical protein P4L16_04675 [Chlamydiales bacterium]|nr:hypothetical protein [Chlamydiales bacterium]
MSEGVGGVRESLPIVQQPAPEVKVSAQLTEIVVRVCKVAKEQNAPTIIERIRSKFPFSARQIGKGFLYIDIFGQARTILNSGLKIAMLGKPLPPEPPSPKKEADSLLDVGLKVLNTGLKVYGIAMSSIGGFTKGAALKGEVERLRSIFIWGTFYDKVEGVLNFLSALVGFLAISFGTVSSIAGRIVAPVLSLPLLVIRLLLQVLYTVKGIINTVYISRNLSTIDKLLSTKEENQKRLLDTLKAIQDLDNKIRQENNELRVQHKGESVSFEIFLSGRYEGRLVKEWSYHIKSKLFYKQEGVPYYKKVMQDIENVQHSLDEVIERLDILEALPEASEDCKALIEQKVALEKQLEKMISAGIKWIIAVRDEMQRERNMMLSSLLALIASTAAVVLGMFTAPYAVLAVLIATIIASLLRITFDVLALQKDYTITKNQQQWIGGIVAEALVAEARASTNRLAFVKSYNFTKQCPEDEFFKEFKKFIKQRILEQGAKGLLSGSLLEKLKAFDREELSEDANTKLREDFNKILNRLIVPSSNKLSLTEDSPTWKLLKQMKGDFRLKELIDDCSFQYQKQHKKFMRKFVAVKLDVAPQSL